MLGFDLIIVFFAAMAVVLLLSAAIVLWLKQNKKRINPLWQWAILLLTICLCITGVKLAGDHFGFGGGSGKDFVSTGNPYRDALLLLQESYPSWTSANNVALVDREKLIKRFEKIETLELGDLKEQAKTLTTSIRTAPDSGRPGIYNMQITAEIKSRWEKFRQDLEKKAAEKS